MNGNIEYKCPCCGGAVVFDSSIQKMKCPYCDTEFDVSALNDEEFEQAHESDFQWTKTQGEEWQAKDGMRVYTCASCGGEIICEDTVSATECPYCGNPQIILSQLTGELKPDCIIPFKLDKNAAKRALEEHLMHKTLLPKVFKDENHIDEIKGIYLPFWLFDADSTGKVKFRAEKVRHWSDRKYDYEETSYYTLIRSGNLSFDNIPADGSAKTADDLTESLEPYDTSQLQEFQSAYLSGFLADKYDIKAEDCSERINMRIKHSLEEAMRGTVHGYSSVHVSDSFVNVKNGEVKYALFPVWILNTTYRGENFIFAMNGQTGKMVGDLPLDKKAYAKWLFGIWGISAVVVFLIMILIMAL